MKQQLNLFSATNIVVANMIGAGIFMTSGLLMAELNNPVLMLVLWGVGGVIALCGAIAYGELGANIPEAGGEYKYLKELYHPMLGFLSGWVSFIVGFSAPIAASAMGFSEYFFRAMPSDMRDRRILGSVKARIIFAKMMMGLFMLASTIAVVWSWVLCFLVNGFTVWGWMSFGLTLMLPGVAQICWAIWAFGHGDLYFWIAAVCLVLFVPFYIGAEIRKPSKNLPGSLLAGTMIVLILYLGLNAVFIYSIPADDMKGVISIGGLAMKNLFGGPAETLFSILIAFALFSSLSAFIIIGPRVYYSMAKDGLFFKAIARIHPRFEVPSNAIVLQSLIAIVMVVSGTFEQILTYMGFALGIFPILTVLAGFRLRRRKPSAIQLAGFPVAHIVYITAGLLILFLAYFERPVESSIALLTVLIGIPAYYIFKRQH